MQTSIQTTTAIRSILPALAVERVDHSLRRANPAPPPSSDSQHRTLCTVGSTAKLATYQEVCAVPVPESTYHEKTGNRVYNSIAYATPIDHLRDYVSDLMGSDPVYETYALNKTGSEVYGRIAWDAGVPGMLIEVVMRSSYGGTICLEWGIGQGTFICANGMISAEQIIKIKHTHNAIQRFADSLNDVGVGVMGKIEDARKRLTWIDGLREIPMSDDLFHAFTGVLQGRDLLTPHRASAARRYWGACHSGDLHDDHAGNNLFSGYQALTGANHLSTPRNAFKDAAGVDFMTEAVEQSGGSLTGIPAFNFNIEEF
jgi:hypothetical protein